MSCGAAEQHQVVCITATVTPVTAASTTATITVSYSTSSVEFGFDDPQTMTLTGSITGAWNFTMDTAFGSSQNVPVGTRTLVVNTSYTTASTYNFGAVISNQYLGGTPSHVLAVTVPKRPPSIPSAPGISVGTITPSSAVVTVTASTSNGGAVVDQYAAHIATDSAFTNVVATWTGTGAHTVTGLLPGTKYWTRVRAHNAAGYSAWSSVLSLTTLTGAQVKVAGTWRAATAYVKVAGVWKPCVGVHEKVSGTWH